VYLPWAALAKHDQASSTFTYRRNLGRQVYALGDLELSGLKGALEVNVDNLLAKVCLGANQADQTVLDSQQNIGAFLNPLVDGTLCLDDQLLATIVCILVFWKSAHRTDLRHTLWVD
jgi:hypothetical protein